MSTTNLRPTTRRTADRRILSRLLWVAPLAMLVSIVTNLLLYWTASAVAPTVGQWSGSSPAQVIGATIVYLLVATVLFAVVVWRASQPARLYGIIATVALLLSLALPIGAGFGFGPPNVPPASAATVLTLSLMHVITYAISVPMFIRLALQGGQR